MGLPYDLKNTYWVGYENPYTPTSEVFYSVNFTVGEYTCTSIGIKNMGSPNGYCLVALPENESTYMILYSGATFSWLYSGTFEFIDGDDIANADLLSFMHSSFGYLDGMEGSYWIWLSSETFEDPDGFGASFEFSAGGTSYEGFYAIDGELTYYPASGGSITAYDSTNGWASDDYKSFIVTDAWQDDENLQILLTNYMTPAFLPAPDVIISYKGAEIATLSDSGTKTLQTQGKYCEDDIEVSYTKSGGGGSDFEIDVYDVPVRIINQVVNSIVYNRICYNSNSEQIYATSVTLTKGMTNTTAAPTYCTLVDGAVELCSSTNKELSTTTGTIEYIRVANNMYKYRITPNDGISMLILTQTNTTHVYD